MNSRKSSLNKCETGRIKMMKAKIGTIVPISGRRRVLRGTRAIMTGRRRVLGVSSQVLGGDGIVEATPKMKVC